MLIRLLCLILVSLPWMVASETGLKGSNPAWAMRDRVYANPDLGIAVHYPYRWRVADQYGSIVLGDTMHSIQYRADAPPEEVAAALAKANAALEVFGRTDATKTPHAVAETTAGESLVWAAWDYYQQPQVRPHAAKDWAPEGVTAELGTGKTHCVLMLSWGDHVAGVVVAGSPADTVVAGILNSLEVLAIDVKARKAKPNPKAPALPLMTWREAQWHAGNAVAANGTVVKPPAGKTKPMPVAWTQAWEIETPHFHVTANTDPGRLVWHGTYLEALFRAYSKVYQPERFPSYKAEVHIFDKQQQFKDASSAWGLGFSISGGIVGGFFVPDLYSLWVFEESGALGGNDFSVEHVTAHECSHQFLYLATNGNERVPTWLNEGLAVYFEAGIFKDGEFQIRMPRERINRLKSGYQSEHTTLAPLESYLGHYDHIDALQYGEVFAMTHFWIFGQCQGERCKHTDCGLSRFRTYWNRLKKGDDGTQAFEEVFMTDMIKAQGSRDRALEQWKKALMQYVNTLK